MAERGFGLYLAAPCLVITAGVTIASAWSVLVATEEETERTIKSA